MTAHGNQRIILCLEFGASYSVLHTRWRAAAARRHIRLDGRDLTGLRAFERTALGMALVPEGRHVFPFMSVREAYLGRSAARRAQRGD